MAGFLTSTGMLTNEGNNFLDIKDDLEHKIKNIIIYNVPIKTSNTIKTLKEIGEFLSPIIHSALTPTLSHIAIQLNLELSDYIYIIEYGQYYSKDSTIKSSSFNSNINSSKEPRKTKNNLDYYYINEDGARITKISYKQLESYPIFKLYCILNDNKRMQNAFKIQTIAGIIGEGFYGEIRSNNFKYVICDIKNKITLRELCNNLKNENWLAKKYNIVFNNCQTFASEIIKILKAIRMHEVDKIRINEKINLPSCLIWALWRNENLSLKNTLGRIPVFGLFYDLIILYNNNK